MIIKAKKQYRKLYLAGYNKKYREKNTQITFRISKKQYKKFEKLAKKEKVKVSFYIKQLALKNQNHSSHSDIKKLKFLLLQTIDITEEAIEENESVDGSALLPLLEKIQKLIR
ncbi:MAG: hypothetical protein COB12_04755 [Flavobacterium sp.]|nr:MAG: hypothetical protein COB12_04755 [Flavobacterium sp.]